MSEYTDYRMARGVAHVVGGLCCLCALAWTLDTLFIPLTLYGLGFGIWDVRAALRISGEDEERERSAPARIEAATAGLESVRVRREDA